MVDPAVVLFIRDACNQLFPRGMSKPHAVPSFVSGNKHEESKQGAGWAQAGFGTLVRVVLLHPATHFPSLNTICHPVSLMAGPLG